MDEKLPWRSAIHFVTVYSWQVHFSPHKSSHQGNNPAEKKFYSTTSSSSCIAYQLFFLLGLNVRSSTCYWTAHTSVVVHCRHEVAVVVCGRPSSLSLYVQRVSRPAVCVCADVYPGSIPVAPPKSPWQDKRSRKEHSATERSRHKSRQSSAPNPSAESHISK